MHPSTGVRGHRHPAAPESAGQSWQQLRAEYLGSTISLRALAAARGLSYDALKRRARREGWAAVRAADVCSARRRRDLEELARARDEAFRAAKRLLAMPAGAEPGRLAEAAREAASAAGMLQVMAANAARMGISSP